MAHRTKSPKSTELQRERLLDQFKILRIPISGEALDEILARASKQRLSYLAFLDDLIGEQANLRRERSIERRIRHARFAERKELGSFDWDFNKKAIDRLQIEELATADFVRRKDNVVFVGKSGVGKSHIIQAVGIQACAAGFSVRYTTSAALIESLTAALADKTLTKALGRFTRPQLLIIDEFGFDRVERSESPEAASLLYKVVHARSNKGSTALLTNIDFGNWGDYLGDPPLSMALLDRLVDNAIILKINGRSYRAEKAKRKKRAAKTQARPAPTRTKAKAKKKRGRK